MPKKLSDAKNADEQDSRDMAQLERGLGETPKTRAEATRRQEYSAELEQMINELEAALDADQKQRAAGLEKTVGATRAMKEEEMMQKIERASRDATQFKQPVYPMPVQPPQQQPAPMPTPAPMPAPAPAPMPAQPMAMTPAPPPAQPMPTPAPPMPQPMPQMPAPQPMAGLTPEQMVMLQRQLYGG